MIKKLRVQFVVIIMSLVSVVLLIAFAAICFTSYNSYISDTQRALDQALELSAGKGMPTLEIGGKPTGERLVSGHVYCVLVDEDGRATMLMSENVEVSDEVLAQSVEAALASGADEGTIKELNLRFKIQRSDFETKIAFADLSSETANMRGLVLRCLLIGGLGLLALFLISLFLSALAVRPVQAAWERQRQFVADASHELKTPLTVILANMKILLNNRQSSVDEQTKWIENTQAESVRMKRLVDDLLYLAKTDNMREQTILSKVNLSNVVWESTLPFESVAFENGVEIRTEIEPGLCVMGDESALRQLVRILMDNACKYTPTGGVVSAMLGHEAGRVILRVHNTGPGVPREDLDRSFERFYRGDKARQSGGYGLGLSIAKGIVDAHTGKMFAESAAADGTSFIVSLKKAG